MPGSEDYDPPGDGESIRPKSDDSEAADGPLDAVADTTPPMEGFQTGSGFDLEGSPSEESPDPDPELGVLVTRANTFDELDLVSDSPEPVENVDSPGWEFDAQAGPPLRIGVPTPPFWEAKSGVRRRLRAPLRNQSG